MNKNILNSPLLLEMSTDIFTWATNERLKIQPYKMFRCCKSWHLIKILLFLEDFLLEEVKQNTLEHGCWSGSTQVWILDSAFIHWGQTLLLHTSTLSYAKQVTMSPASSVSHEQAVSSWVPSESGCAECKFHKLPLAPEVAKKWHPPSANCWTFQVMIFSGLQFSLLTFPVISTYHSTNKPGLPLWGPSRAICCK